MTFTLPIDATLKALLLQEDTDNDKKITVEDKGPKSFNITSDSGKIVPITGTYNLSNLLQELVIAKRSGKQQLEVALHTLTEAPVQRISRMIRDYYWKGLTRTMDASGIEALIADTKNDSLTDETLHIYVPYADDLALNYYKNLEQNLPVKAVKLPKDISPEYVKSINTKPGILALALAQENGQIKGVPFVVPGGRFNEMYGWDSYFESVGLLLDGHVDLAKAMADNFKYQITHYGKILNANRSYYLTRTQPPFYTSLIREVYQYTKDNAWLASHLETAIHEYNSVWMQAGVRLTDIGLNRYLAQGIGITPEVEEGHYDAVFNTHANKAGISLEQYIAGYAQGKIKNEQLDLYFIHDRTVRESGHDTSYRIEGNCGDLVLVELNAMLYKYETDFGFLIKSVFDDHFVVGDKVYHGNYWTGLATKRKTLMNRYMWNQQDGTYYDYNVVTKKQHKFNSATAFAPLWANVASHEQATALVENLLPKLKELGGVASCDLKSRGDVGPDRPQRQWDYPNGWAPHQIMIWRGLEQYGFKKQAQELIYRWLFMITKNAVDYNGTIPEKYDVVATTHKVFAEYGNVGTEFEYITTEGFGWMNASYQYGLSLLGPKLINELNKLTPVKELFNND